MKANENFLDKSSRDILQRMSYMERYNNEIHIHSENVAEHSFYVAVYAMAICDVIGFNGELREIVIEKALIHDIHETVISDIPHNIKANFKSLNEICLNIENAYNKKNFEYLDKKYNMLDIGIQGIVDCVVELADVISVKQYSQREISLGNEAFEKILESAEERIVECFDQLEFTDLNGIGNLKRYLEG